MTAANNQPTSSPSADDEARLDAALANSFPASDPPGHLHGEAIAPSARDVWAHLDVLDAAAFAQHLCPGVHLSWGHARADGRAEVERWLAGWLGGLRALSSTITNAWNVGDAEVLEVELACTRLDGHEATLCAAVVMQPARPPFEAVRVYLELAPLMAATSGTR